MIGVSYQHDNGGGGAITWRGGAACTATYSDINYSEFSLNEEAANDEISSFTDYNYCDTKFYWDANFGGEATAWLNGGSSPTNVGSHWNDEISSIKWS